MAKGFGAIIAEVSAANRAAQFEKVPACPLCGEPMESGAAWFCYTGKDEHAAWLAEHRAAAYAAQEAGQAVFYSDLQLSRKAVSTHRNWDPEMQGVILALAVSPTGEVLYFSSVRGGYGRTNFRVDMPRQSEWVPQPEDWQWAEWTGK